MPSALRSPKTLSNWIELDYHKRRRLFRGLWRGLLIVAALGAVAGLVVMASTWGHRGFQAGPLSAPHAMFNHDCKQCHDGDFSTLARVWGGKGVSVPDSKCLACHAGSHHNEPHAAMGRCVDCHKEHRGHAALLRIDDAHCVRCHDNLKRQDGSPPGAPYGSDEPYARSVTAFTPSGHPPFRYSRGNEANYPDPGTVRFPHNVHLAEGGVLDLDPKQRGELPRSRMFTKLGCADCHQTDAEGRYMQPISYEQHCARCHPLGTPVPGDFKDAGQKKLALDFAWGRLPHPRKGQGPGIVRAALRDQLSRFITRPSGKLFLGSADEPVPPRPLPDRHPAEQDGPAMSERAFNWVNRSLALSERVVFEGAGGCRYCHPGAGVNAQGPAVPPAGIKDRWWEHGLFNHKTHRMLDCAQCHDAGSSANASDVLLPGVDNCLKCHTKGTEASARGHCVKCHVYHDPAKQRAARGAGKRTLGELKP